MVIIKNKRMIFSEEDRYVGTRYDANTKTLTFGLYYNYNTERWIGDLTFNLIIRYSDTNETDILVVVKGNTSIGTDGTAVKELSVTFTETALSHSGTHLIQLTGFDIYKTYRWSSYQSFIYIEDALNAKPISVTTLSLLEAYEAQLTNKLLLLQATEDQVVLEEANRKVAETARADAETARVAAEESRVDAEAARVEAESSRADAEAARVTAETARETAESKRVEAEAARVETESARVEAESARADAEIARTNAEAARAAAENSRAEAENARVAAEDARAKAEVARESIEKARVQAEESREDAENSRVVAENARVDKMKQLESGYDAASLRAMSYAVGGTGTRSGEDTDNAKYYKEQAQAISQGTLHENSENYLYFGDSTSTSPTIDEDIVGAVTQDPTSKQFALHRFEDMSARMMAAENWRQLRMHQNILDNVEETVIDVALTNSQTYPHNNSQKTVAFETYRNRTDYYVYPEVIASSGGSVGDVVISDKLVNGFKVAFTGSATNATVRCHVFGGM